MRRPPDAIETQRLTLRRWSLGDTPALRVALDRSDAHLRPWIPFMRHEPRSLEETRSWMVEIMADFDANRHYRYAVWLGAPAILVGEVMLLSRQGPGVLELGYWIHVDHCGEGYATEASQALVKLAFAGAISEVVLLCDVENEPSHAVARKLGAVDGGREREVGSGGPVSLVRWQLRPAEITEG